MLWFATQLMYKFGNPPILIVTDRKQLEKQIHETFKSCGFPTPIKAKSSSELQVLLKNPKGKTIMTTIQKFGIKGDHNIIEKPIHTDGADEDEDEENYTSLFPKPALRKDKKFIRVLKEIKNDFEEGCRDFTL